MNSKGFFSVFVAAFAVIFLISTFYSQSVQFESQSRAAELGVLQQELSKDWFMVRNALVNFASDAILFSIEEQYTAANGALSITECNSNEITSYDYASDVNDYWHSAVLQMNKRFGTNCDVNVSGDVRQYFEGPSIPMNSVLDAERAYGLLSCTRSSAKSSLTIKQPFVIRKDVRVPASCTIEVWDILGSSDAVFPIDFEELDVTQTYP